MSIDFATLGIEVKTAGLRDGEAELRTFANTAQDTERRVGRATSEMTRGFRLNRIGMMEMQAAGINSFQALAAGMDPLHVAMMESSQVVGAFVQGTEGGIAALKAAFIGFATNPVTLAIAGITALSGAMLYLDGFFHSTKDAAKEASDAMKGLKSAMSEVESAAKSANMSMFDLRSQFGQSAGEARQLNMVLLSLAEFKAKSSLQQATGKITEGLSGLLGYYQKYEDLSTSVYASEDRRRIQLEQIQRQIRGIKDEYGLTLVQATQVTRAVEMMRDASSPQNMAKGAVDLANVLRDVARTGAEIPPQLLAVSQNAAQAAIEALRLKGYAEDADRIEKTMASNNIAGPISAAAGEAGRLALNLLNAANYWSAFGGAGAGRGDGMSEWRMRQKDQMGTGLVAPADPQSVLGKRITDLLNPPKPRGSGLKKLTDLQREEKSILEQLQGPLKTYQTTQQALDDLLKRKVITQDQYNQKLGEAKVKYLQADEAGKFYLQTTQSFEQSMSQAIATGQGLAGVLSNLAAKFAEAAIQASLFGTGPLSGGGSVASPGSSLFGGLISGLLGGGGSTWSGGGGTVTSLFASGTSYAPGGTAIVGENGPEAVKLPRGAQVVPARQTAAMMGGGGHVHVTVSMDNNGNLQAFVDRRAGNISAAHMSTYDSQVLPIRVGQINRNPDIVGA